jgi:UDP-N-acetylmuramoylalanine--D-glutamate ligase
VTSRDPDGVMREAVALAAAALGEGGGTVLLAPIGTSFDLYEDYKARGAAFTRAARALLSERAEAERDGVGSGA